MTKPSPSVGQPLHEGVAVLRADADAEQRDLLLGLLPDLLQDRSASVLPTLASPSESRMTRLLAPRSKPSRATW